MANSKARQVLIFSILLVAGMCSLTWVPWPFTVASEPKQAHATTLQFSDQMMTKNSTFYIKFTFEVIQDSYVWFGGAAHPLVLDSGQNIYIVGKQVSNNGTYYKGETISAQYSFHTGTSAPSFGVTFYDSTGRFQLKFRLAPYRVEKSGIRSKQQEKNSGMLLGSLLKKTEEEARELIV